MPAQSESVVETRHLSLDEWAALPADHPGELVDGALVEEEMADYIHDVVVGWLIAVVGSWVLAREASSLAPTPSLASLVIAAASPTPPCTFQAQIGRPPAA